MTHLLSTAIIEGADSRIEIDSAELKVVSGPDRGFKLLLGADSILIGSSEKCQLVLHDPTVSTRHAEVMVTSRGYVIRDLGSKNGILLGANPIERAPLSDGMRLNLGSSTLVVRSLKKRTSVKLGRAGEFGDLTAYSVKMRALVALLEPLSASDVTTLIEGETGTGKEVAARAIHQASSRKHGNFVVFDCGAVAQSLIAAELFGYEKGAFTGASAARAGMFEEADGGTLFLDEIGELPQELQPMLLGAIERKVSRRLGGQRDIRHDVRVIAATNRNLAEEVRARRFREDLFFRIAVGRVRMPPLRERPEDLPRLADLFAQEVGVTLSPEFLVALGSHEWPGNLRELRNLITRLAVDPDAPLPGGGDYAVESAADVSLFSRPLPEARKISGHAFEREYLEKILARAEGNVSRAAQLAGISRRVFTLLVAKHNLRARDRASD